MQSECSRFSNGIAFPVSSTPVVFPGISFILPLILSRVRVRVQLFVYPPVVQREKISFSALDRRRLYTLFLSGKLEFRIEFLFQRSVWDVFILSLFLWRVRVRSWSSFLSAQSETLLYSLSFSGELEFRMSFSHSFMSYCTNNHCASFYVQTVSTFLGSKLSCIL